MHRLRALFLSLVLILLFMLGGCSDGVYNFAPKAENGTLDLSRGQPENNVVELGGSWEFYWNQLLSPDQLEGETADYIKVPGSWNKYCENRNSYPGNGFATYRLALTLEGGRSLALKIPRINTAYKLWINSELKASAGIVGEQRNGTKPQYLSQVVFFESEQGKNEIVIQISNFHQRSGGMLETIMLGGREQITNLQYMRVARDVFLFGALIFMGIYQISLFFFRRKERAPLYFGLFCALLGIRTILVGDAFFMHLFPGFSWEIAHKIQTLTYYFGMPLILMFFRSVFPECFHKRLVRLGLYVGLIFGLLVIFTPVRVFSRVNLVHQVWSVVLVGYIIIMLLRKAFKSKDFWLVTIGALALALSGLNDILFYSIWRYDYGPAFLESIVRTGNLSAIGQIIFTISNSFLLAQRFSISFEREEAMTRELIDVNANLDRLVLQRTEALARSNEEIEHQKLELEKANRELWQMSLRDPLTGIWNRRKYNESINVEWYRSLRYQRPIALILLDIDYFKQFNDIYGHMAGDECLIRIAQVISDSFLRSSDVVARYGGEEFLALLPETGREDAIKIANRLLQKVEDLKIPHENSPISDYLTASIGVTSIVPTMSNSHEDLFKIADCALYQAKAGRNQVKFLS